VEERLGAMAQTVTVTNSSVEGATGATLGELFEYNFAGPVTIKKNQSAMLPFLQDKIAARKLLIYKDGDGDHPVNAAEVTNNTAKTLDGGPITVYEDGAYAGEALVETFKAGDKRLIGYAVDYGTLVQTDDESDDNKIVREISAKQGILTLRYAERATTTYSVKNVDSKAKTLIVQQEGTDYKVLSPKPLERTSTAYRFEVRLPANGSQELKVERERLLNEETAVTGATPDSLIEIVQNKQLTDAGRRQLQVIIDLKSKLVESQASINALSSHNSELTDEQNRLRQNIDSLNRVKGQEEQVRQYSSRLGANEAEMAKLRDQRDAEVQHKKSLDTDLRNAIAKLQF
jgi:cell division protein FtsB